MVSQSHFSSGSTRTTVSISSSSSSSSSFTTGSSLGPKSSGLRALKQDRLKLGQLKQFGSSGPLEAPHSLLLFLDEVVFNNFVQTRAVRLDETFHLHVVQRTNLVIIELFIKLKQQKNLKRNKDRNVGRLRHNKSSPSQIGRPAATAARSSSSPTKLVSTL